MDYNIAEDDLAKVRWPPKKESVNRTVIVPWGIFQTRDGVTTVFEFDDEGNWYAIPIEEQHRRIDLAKAATSRP